MLVHTTICCADKEDGLGTCERAPDTGSWLASIAFFGAKCTNIQHAHVGTHVHLITHAALLIHHCANPACTCYGQIG